MTAWLNRFASLLLIGFFVFAYAQEEAVGIVSYIDIEGAGLRVGSCLGEEPDPRTCVPNTEVIHIGAFEACGGNLSGCEEKVAYSVPFISEEVGINIEEDVDEAWGGFTEFCVSESEQRYC